MVVREDLRDLSDFPPELLSQLVGKFTMRQCRGLTKQLRYVEGHGKQPRQCMRFGLYNGFCHIHMRAEDRQ
jgi:hypothetical protein